MAQNRSQRRNCCLVCHGKHSALWFFTLPIIQKNGKEIQKRLQVKPQKVPYSLQFVSTFPCLFGARPRIKQKKMYMCIVGRRNMWNCLWPWSSVGVCRRFYLRKDERNRSTMQMTEDACAKRQRSKAKRYWFTFRHREYYLALPQVADK